MAHRIKPLPYKPKELVRLNPCGFKCQVGMGICLGLPILKTDRSLGKVASKISKL